MLFLVLLFADMHWLVYVLSGIHTDVLAVVVYAPASWTPPSPCSTPTDTCATELVVLDASNLAAGPVAVLRTETPIPVPVHVSWSPVCYV